jgi:hypothetical protein
MLVRLLLVGHVLSTPSNHRNRRRNGGWAAGADRQARRGRRAAPAGPQQGGGPRRSRGCGMPRRAYRAATPTRQVDAGGQRHRAARAMSIRPGCWPAGRGLPAPPERRAIVTALPATRLKMHDGAQRNRARQCQNLVLMHGGVLNSHKLENIILKKSRRLRTTAHDCGRLR